MVLNSLPPEFFVADPELRLLDYLHANHINAGRGQTVGDQRECMAAWEDVKCSRHGKKARNYTAAKDAVGLKKSTCQR